MNKFTRPTEDTIQKLTDDDIVMHGSILDKLISGELTHPAFIKEQDRWTKEFRSRLNLIVNDRKSELAKNLKKNK